MRRPLTGDPGPWWNTTGRVSGLYYHGTHCVVGSAGALTLNELYAAPFQVGNLCRFDRIVSPSLAVASSLVRLGIYADDRGRPGALILDAGQVSCASAGNNAITIDVTLKGVVWLAAVGQSVAPSLSRYGYHVNPLVGCVSPYGTGGAIGYSQGSISGALPSTWGSTLTERAAANVVPIVYLRAK